MAETPIWRRYLRFLGSDPAGDVEDELSFHFAMRVEDLMQRGVPEPDARRQASQEFGDVEEIRDELEQISRQRLQRQNRARWWESLGQDLRFAVRTLRKSPGFTAVAVLTLALGIGATTGMFSIIDALMLRPLPVQQSDRLTFLSGDDTWFGTGWTNPIWEAVRDRPGLYDGAFAFSATTLELAERDERESVAGLRASGRMFDVLGVQALLGRTFSEANDRRDGGPDGPVAVISHDFWQRRYGGAHVLGRNVSLNRVPFTIVGVTPPGFFGPEVGRTFDIAVPLGTVALLNGDAAILESRSSWWLRVVIRRASSQNLEEATAAFRAVQPQIANETRPANLRPEDAARHLVRPFILLPIGSSFLRHTYQRPLVALMAIVALTLLIACGNIASMLLARAAGRRYEFSVRTAIGASGWRLARQLLTESLLLSVAGAALGMVFALWGSRLLILQLSTAADGFFLDVSLHWRILAFAAAVTVGTALLFGIAPALRAARVAPVEAMKEAGRGSTSERRVGLAGSLVAAQVALSLVLVVGAFLFVRTLASLTGLDVGFDRNSALLVHMSTPGGGVDSGDRRLIYQRVLEDVRALPSVSDAALSTITPVQGQNSTSIMAFPDRPDFPESERRVWLNNISPGWFAALGMPLIAGRDFDDRDRPGAPRSVIVNRTFAEKYYGNESPIGREIRENPGPTADPTPLEIVGVVGDAVYRSLREPVPATMYLPLAQQAWSPANLSLVVRPATGDPAALTRSITTAVSRVNADLSLDSRTLSDQVNASITQDRIVATVAGFMGALALLLAAIGLYGITAHVVSRRQLEMGIRMALGSTPAGVMRLMLVPVALLIGGGILIGTVLSWWTVIFAEAMIFGFMARDPATIAGAVAVLVGVGAFAGWLPAARAARVDPARLLREK